MAGSAAARSEVGDADVDSPRPSPPHRRRTTARARRGRGLAGRLFRLVGASVATVLVATLVLLDAAARQTASAAGGAGLARTTRVVTVLLAGRERALAGAVDVFAQNPAFRALLLDGRVEDLRDQALEAAERTGATWVQVVDSQGVRVARSDDPTAPRASLGGSVLVAGALAGEAMQGVGVAGPTGS